MKGFGGKARTVGILIIFFSIMLFMFMNQKKYEVGFHTNVDRWDNLYKGNNIHFYYINSDINEIVTLRKTYEIDKVVPEGTTDIEATIQLDKWLKTKCNVALDIIDMNKTAKEILENLIKNTTLSQKDYNRVIHELLASLGVKSRMGELGGVKIYHILEVWDREMKQWVAYDVINGGYYVNENGPLSGVEFITGEINSVNLTLYNGENKSLSKKNLKEIKSSLDSYTIKIDNSLYEGTLINSLVTFVINEENIQLETEKGYIKPTIFTMESELFNGDPWKEYVDDQSDKIPTVIFSKKNVSNDGNDFINFTLGAFMNSIMVEKYYVRINSGQFTEVNQYYDLTLYNGKNVIEVSLDGVNTVRTIVINKN